MRSKAHEILSGAGALLFVVAGACMDSEQMIVPAVLAVIGIGIVGIFGRDLVEI